MKERLLAEQNAKSVDVNGRKAKLRRVSGYASARDKVLENVEDAAGDELRKGSGRRSPRELTKELDHEAVPNGGRRHERALAGRDLLHPGEGLVGFLVGAEVQAMGDARRPHSFLGEGLGEDARALATRSGALRVPDLLGAGHTAGAQGERERLRPGLARCGLTARDGADKLTREGGRE